MINNIPNNSRQTATPNCQQPELQPGNEPEYIFIYLIKARVVHVGKRVYSNKPTHILLPYLQTKLYHTC